MVPNCGWRPSPTQTGLSPPSTAASIHRPIPPPTQVSAHRHSGDYEQQEQQQGWGPREEARVLASTACENPALVRSTLTATRGDVDLAIEQVCCSSAAA